MSKYGKASVRAVHLFTTGITDSPKEAWTRATGELFESKSSREKGCPKNAFLGLCEEGLIRGISSGQYTNSLKNKQYALDAVAILRRSPELATDLNALWKAVMREERKVHNSQMDVVVALWNAGLLVHNA